MEREERKTKQIDEIAGKNQVFDRKNFGGGPGGGNSHRGDPMGAHGNKGKHFSPHLFRNASLDGGQNQHIDDGVPKSGGTWKNQAGSGPGKREQRVQDRVAAAAARKRVICFPDGIRKTEVNSIPIRLPALIAPAAIPYL